MDTDDRRFWVRSMGRPTSQGFLWHCTRPGTEEALCGARITQKALGISVLRSQLRCKNCQRVLRRRKEGGAS